MTTTINPALSEVRFLIGVARTPKIRSIRQFAEDEIIIPDGPFKGRRFRVDRNPVSRLWFEAVDSGRWNRLVATGPTQSGKTLKCFVIPTLYHLFELNETVICGVPNMDMAGDKWREDLFPAIEASRFRDLLPRDGAGSRGGKVEAIKFRNGATLKFMSGGGGDKKRAAFTSRVLVVTETDGMDEAGVSSREADKITQMEARTRAFGSRKRIYLECTVSIEQGRTWREYKAGTESRIAVQCPHCDGWVIPEREDLVGWQDSESVLEAREQSAFACSACGGLWSEQQRHQMNRGAKLFHRGQEISPNGEVVGIAPQVDTLGFRWHAFHNMLIPASDVAMDEWHAQRDADEDNAEKEMRQFVWALPHIPSIEKEHHVEIESIIHRQHKEQTRAVVSPECELLTAGVDVGKYLLHWVVIGWAVGARGHVVDYGRIEVPSSDMPLEQAVLVALREWREIATTGFPQKDPVKGKQLLAVEESWVDSGYQTEAVYHFCRESGRGFQAVKGYGASQRVNRYYHSPDRLTDGVRHIGDGHHITWLTNQGIALAHINSDHWKTWVHGALTCPKDGPGAMTLFRGEPREHLSFAKHLTAEEKTTEFVPGKGERVIWNQKRKNNHWFDTVYMASAAGNYRGVRLIEPTDETVKGETRVHLPRRPDGQSFFVTNR